MVVEVGVLVAVLVANVDGLCKQHVGASAVRVVVRVVGGRWVLRRLGVHGRLRLAAQARAARSVDCTTTGSRWSSMAATGCS